jgi:hypothetical protein
MNVVWQGSTSKANGSSLTAKQPQHVASCRELSPRARILFILRTKPGFPPVNHLICTAYLHALCSALEHVGRLECNRTADPLGSTSSISAYRMYSAERSLHRNRLQAFVPTVIGNML